MPSINVTEVNKETGMVTFDYKDKTHTVGVQAPCKIEYIKVGKGEVSFKDNLISYFKSSVGSVLGQKKSYTPRPKESSHHGQIKCIKGLNPIEFAEIYNEFSKKHWTTASNFEDCDGERYRNIFWNKRREEPTPEPADLPNELL